ncbi:hypothetical protein OH77DRAFT_67118 [Trametes cingulata]|nr:hypothetical protein OH77DRAFT_67118 [Trametes cingulata]
MSYLLGLRALKSRFVRTGTGIGRPKRPVPSGLGSGMPTHCQGSSHSRAVYSASSVEMSLVDTSTSLIEEPRVRRRAAQAFLSMSDLCLFDSQATLADFCSPHPGLQHSTKSNRRDMMQDSAPGSARHDREAARRAWRAHRVRGVWMAWLAKASLPLSPRPLASMGTAPCAPSRT